MPKLFAVLVVSALSTIATRPGLAAGNDFPPGRNGLEWCLLGGGEPIPQPDGSPIQACCVPEGCFICDDDWYDCEFEPDGAHTDIHQEVAPSTPGASIGGFQIQLAPPNQQVR